MLARSLGMTLGELSHRMTRQELLLWQAEYAREPWGELRAELRMGRQCEVVVNVANPKAKTPPKDFMFRWDRKAVSDPDEMKQAMLGFVQALKGNVVTRGDNKCPAQ